MLGQATTTSRLGYCLGPAVDFSASSLATTCTVTLPAISMTFPAQVGIVASPDNCSSPHSACPARDRAVLVTQMLIS